MAASNHFAELVLLLQNCCVEGMAFKGIEYNKFKFKLIDVPGDGNCLYHSLVCSGVIERSSVSLRLENFKCVLKNWQNGSGFVTTLNALYSKDIPLLQYTAEQKQNGKWGSTLDMCFV